MKPIQLIAFSLIVAGLFSWALHPQLLVPIGIAFVVVGLVALITLMETGWLGKKK